MAGIHLAETLDHTRQIGLSAWAARPHQGARTSWIAASCCRSGGNFPGRAGKEGLAISLLTESEHYKLQAIGLYQSRELEFEAINRVQDTNNPLPQPAFVTLCIHGGRKEKVRAGDVLGALTGEAGIDGKAVGKITVTEYSTYVAIARPQADRALGRLLNGKIKGRKFKVRKL